MGQSRLIWIVGAVVLSVIGGAAGLTLKALQERDPDTRIVQEVRAQGGEPRGASVGDLMLWFGKRQEFAAHVAGECQSVAKNAPVRWGQTTEGAVCRAVMPVAAFTALQYKAIN